MRLSVYHLAGPPRRVPWTLPWDQPCIPVFASGVSSATPSPPSRPSAAQRARRPASASAPGCRSRTSTTRSGRGRRHGAAREGRGSCQVKHFARSTECDRYGCAAWMRRTVSLSDRVTMGSTVRSRLRPGSARHIQRCTVEPQAPHDQRPGRAQEGVGRL